ncbi:CocE/NonD family hydrolase, partial [Singulisphaera rosea]
NEPSSTTAFLADPVHPNEIPGRAFPGAKDAREVEKQPEVRTFTTEVLTEPVEWTGNVKAEVYLSSTAKDTDVIVRISDVYPDGRSILLMDYIRRVRYREGYDREVFLEPGQVAKVAFDVGWTSQVFNRGHRIRITLASTGAPFYEPNPNTGEPLTIDPPARTVVATNTVHHEKAHPSRIIAPGRPKADPDEVRKTLGQTLQKLQEWVDARHNAIGIKPDTLANAAVFVKGIDWALRFESTLTPADIGQIEKAAGLARGRLTAIEQGRRPWTEKTGQLVRGFVSKVDGSVQPYGVIVPKGYDPKRPIRLDVVLHGSSKPSGMSELRFMSRFDEAKEAPEADYIELHPLGRVENGYRWAGETDVFEAIEAVCRSYNIDRDRIVLRGMSMGASGTWHLGLKHPDRFVALGPYCGYVDTHQFSETPLPNFVKVGPLPSDQEKGLHMLDSVDYAANAGVVPAIACIGDQDIFFQAHEIMGRAMAAEGLTMVNLISHGTGHVIDPATHREQMRRIGQIAEKGLDH